MSRQLTRRDLGRTALLLAAAGAADACTGGSSAPSASQPTSTTSTHASPTATAPNPSPTATAPTPSPTATVSTTPAISSSAATSPLPTTQAWFVRPGEVEPNVKRRATALVEAVASWGTGQGGLAAARKRVAALGLDASLADALLPHLMSGSEATARIVDAQYGGILATTSSVLVVVDQWVRTASGGVHAGGTTVDVRLVKASPRWRVVEVRPAKPGPAVKQLTSAARRVLSDDRIHLPYAAAADINAGRVHDTVLRSLRTLADNHVIDLSVIRSGHPYYVFGTTRRSDHPHGRAADVWAIDGKAVVDPANLSLVEAYMREALATGPWQVGGPVDLDGSAKKFFSDLTHHDHVHMGFHT
jgi:hypothetical protein